MASIGELVASIGHELANPIWAVGGAREQAKFGTERVRDLIRAILGDDPSDEAMAIRSKFDTDIGEIESALGAQEVAVSHMTEISMALRKNARIERKAVPVKLSEVVSDALVLVAGKMKRFEVVTEISEVPEIIGYPGKLAQVLTNLLSNAADALSDNEIGGEVRVRVAEKMSEGKAGLVVTVEDSGPGVPVEIRDRVTEMFFTTKPIGVGTGLGLGISIRIVRGHGGRLTIDSSEDLGGARFEVWLPLAQAQGQDLS
jgi:signal transduction histidine kinase